MKALSGVFQHRVHFVVILATIASLFLGGMNQASAQNPSGISQRSVQADFAPISLAVPNCDYGGLIQSIDATDQYTVTFNLCRPDPAFLSRVAMIPFAIYPQEWIAATSGSTNRTAQGLESPVGTGPYKASAWDKGSSITFVRNMDYWGAASETDTLVLRWNEDPGARLLELQAGTIDGYDNVAPGDYATVTADPGLQAVTRPALNTFYIGMNNHYAPFGDVRVRQAIAMGIDRQNIIDTLYSPGSEVATYFTPCSIPNGCVGDPWYEFSPQVARAILDTAGFPGGFSTKLYYRNVVRGYLPDPASVAQNIQAQLLANLDINVQVVEMESSAFIQAVQAGQLDGLYMLGWGVDYPHVSNFLDYHFGAWNLQFGSPIPEIYDYLDAALEHADAAEAEPYYTAANNAIRYHVPMVPTAHGATVVAYLGDVTNPQASPLAAEHFALSDPGGRNEFRWMGTYEPASLFCADESDTDPWRACEQIMQPLYTYVNNNSEVEPALAESCVPNAALTTYTCTLRQNVKFHDGSFLDANDVVATFTMGLDASSPTHVGNSNNWDYYRAIWGLMNECYALTLTHTGSGGDPVANPANSTGCDAGKYHAGEPVALTASPAVGWGVESWSGTDNDSSTSTTNTVTMPPNDHTVSVNYISKIVTLTLHSVGAYDGWTLESTENSTVGGSLNATATTLNVGDEAGDKQYRAILSFNTSVLPDAAVILSANLRVKGAGVQGTNPFLTHGSLLADVRQGAFAGSNALQPGDFQAAASKNAVLAIMNNPVNGWYSKAMTPANLVYINLSGITQFRLRFASDDNDDLSADYLKLYSGNYATASSRPQLVIVYYVP